MLLKSSGICENQICSTHGCFLENIDSQKFVCEKTELIKILKNKNAEKLLAGFIRYRPKNDEDYCFCFYIRIINTKTSS